MSSSWTSAALTRSGKSRCSPSRRSASWPCCAGAPARGRRSDEILSPRSSGARDPAGDGALRCLPPAPWARRAGRRLHRGTRHVGRRHRTIAGVRPRADATGIPPPRASSDLGRPSARRDDRPRRPRPGPRLLDPRQDHDPALGELRTPPLHSAPLRRRRVSGRGRGDGDDARRVHRKAGDMIALAAIAAAALLAAGLYLMLSRNVQLLVIGFLLLSNGVNLLVITASGLPAGAAPPLIPGSDTAPLMAD